MGADSVERRWIDWLGNLPDPYSALRAFSRQYHYFSLHQVIAFSRLFQALPVRDRASLAMLADVLHEELGRGDPARVHSALFERFAAAVDTSSGTLPLAASDVVPGVRAYVDELGAAFGGPSLARALATYEFLESSAVETYGPLLGALRGFGIEESDLEFFTLHAEVEQEHARAAREMVKRQCFGAEDQASFDQQLLRMAVLWEAFWVDIAENTRRASAGLGSDANRRLAG